MAALETTKRKFHQLLDNLTSVTPSSSSAFIPGTKRRRIEARGRSSHILKQPLLRSGAPNPPPYYAPWSHDLFLTRLRTFADVHIWSSKPSEVDEVAWAKRGWTCVGFNTVACKGGCEQRVVVSLRPERKDEDGIAISGSEDLSEDISEALVERFADLIEHGHGEECLWRGKACGEEIYRMPIARKAIWLPQLRERYQSLIKVASSLPQDQQLMYTFDTDKVQSQLPQSVFEDAEEERMDNTKPSNESDVAKPMRLDKSALAFALMGWSASTEGGSTVIAHCHACFRRLGLWLYTSQRPSPAEPELQDEATKLDIQHNHRDYCPWINAQSQAMPGSNSSLAGWEFLQKAIHDNAEFARANRLSTAGSQQINSSEDAGVHEGTSEDTSDVLSIKSREQVEKEDNARFARLRELTQSMGLKGLRMKLGKK